MNLSNFSDLNFSAPSPSSIFRGISKNITSPSPVISPSPITQLNPSPSITAPSPFIRGHNSTFEKFNHTTEVSSIRQREINFFFAYVGLSFVVILLFGFFAKKHIYSLLVDSRKYIVEPGDTELKKTNYGIFNSGGESKSYDQIGNLDELEHKERSVGKTADI